MSDVKTNIGKLKKLTIAGTEEEKYKALCQVEGLVADDGEWYDALMDKCYNKYVFVDEDVYEVVVNEETEYENIYHATKGDDNTIDFVVQYYSGGTCFSEAIEEAVNIYKAKEDK